MSEEAHVTATQRAYNRALGKLHGLTDDLIDNLPLTDNYEALENLVKLMAQGLENQKQQEQYAANHANTDTTDTKAVTDNYLKAKYGPTVDKMKNR